MKKDFSNKVKAQYIKLLKNGYYLRPCKYRNTTIYEITKDLNPVNCLAYRTTYGEVNKVTASYLKKVFGFVVKNGCEYFNKAESIPNYVLRYYML